MKEKKKKNKVLIGFVMVLISLVFGLSSYIFYDKVLKEEPKEVEVEERVQVEEVKELSFYDIEELVKNNYIEKIETTETDYIKIANGEVEVKTLMGKETFEKAKGIEGTPKYVYSTTLCSDCQGLGYIVLTEDGNVYYAEEDSYEDESLDFESNYYVTDFKKVNTEEIVNIYYTKIYTINHFYAETSNGDLLTVSKEMSTSNTFKTEYPMYVDYVTALYTDGATVFKIDKDKKIYKEDEQLKYNNEPIIVKDVFAGGNYENITYYIISNDNKIYAADRDGEVKLYTEKEMSNYSTIKTDDSSKSFNLKITYKDGSSETLSEIYATSTIYKRANN